jgi:hypothetical protein
MDNMSKLLCQAGSKPPSKPLPLSLSLPYSCLTTNLAWPSEAIHIGVWHSGSSVS